MAENMQTAREIFLRAHELKCTNQLDAYYECMTDDVVTEDGFSGARQEGRDVLRQGSAAAIAKYHLRWESAGKPTVYETADPDVIVTEYEMYLFATVGGQEHRLTVRDAMFVRVRDGKLAWMRAYSNAGQQLAALAQA